METRTIKPRIKIRLTAGDWITEFVAIVFLIALVAIPVLSYNNLPETIPMHFNGAGQPDGFGGRGSLWLLPATGLIMYLMMTIIQRFPNIYNYPVEITEENASRQYRNGVRLIRVLKTLIMIIFSFISYRTVQTATGSAAGLGKFFLPVFLLITFGIIVFYIVWSLNNRHSS